MGVVGVVPLAFLGATLLVAATASFTARVERVIDGDSLEVSTGDSPENAQVRLFGIDSPERDQPYADFARDELKRLVGGRTVRLEVRDRDSYGRIVARVSVGDTDVNLAQVRAGAAWVYRKYSQDHALLEAEANARRARLGLWAQQDGVPVPPWDWRHGQAATAVAPDARACGGKRVCREMTSCAEARFYLEQCGLSRLDGDSDGVPCESICRK